VWGEECSKKTGARASPTTRATQVGNHAGDAGHAILYRIGHARSDQHWHATLWRPPRRARARSVMTKDGAFPRVRRPRPLVASPTWGSASRQKGQRLHPGWPARCTPLRTATPRAVRVPLKGLGDTTRLARGEALTSVKRRGATCQSRGAPGLRVSPLFERGEAQIPCRASLPREGDQIKSET